MKKLEAVMSVFDLCRKKVNMSTRETFSWLSIPESILDYDSLEANGRYFRLASDVVHVSCQRSDFDRWCNSTEMTFDLTRRSERKLFIDMVEEMTKEGFELKEVVY
jgi:hypothetical protein